VVFAIHARKIPMVQVLHDHYNICPNSQMFKNGRNCVRQCRECWLMRMLHRALTNKIDAVVGVSQYILERHLSEGAYTKVPVKQVIHNVLSAKALGLEKATALREKARIERGNVNVRFGFIGVVSAFKGIERALEAFMALNEPTSELLVAGTGKPKYIALLKEKFPMPQIKFLGQVAPQEFFSAIDVTIVPSLWQENFPGVVSESFAFGVPVIASRRGGIPEMLIGNMSGLLFEPDRPDELGRSMRYFVDHPDEIARMGGNALAASKPFLDFENWATSYELVFKKVCGTANRKGIG
jgi:glycosyltransferase involved in cell wall biosynthesis